jgi:septum formation topological specificity factor MinE
MQVASDTAVVARDRTSGSSSDLLRSDILSVLSEGIEIAKV